MKFTSPAFEDRGVLPQRFTCDGAGISPPFRWDEVTPGTLDFAFICEDPGAPGGVFTHWLLYNIPAGTRSLEEGLPNDEALSIGADQGTNDFGNVGYGPACPREALVSTIMSFDSLSSIKNCLYVRVQNVRR